MNRYDEMPKIVYAEISLRLREQIRTGSGKTNDTFR